MAEKNEEKQTLTAKSPRSKWNVEETSLSIYIFIWSHSLTEVGHTIWLLEFETVRMNLEGQTVFICLAWMEAGDQ